MAPFGALMRRNKRSNSTRKRQQLPPVPPSPDSFYSPRTPITSSSVQVYSPRSKSFKMETVYRGGEAEWEMLPPLGKSSGAREKEISPMSMHASPKQSTPGSSSSLSGPSSGSKSDATTPSLLKSGENSTKVSPNFANDTQASPVIQLELTLSPLSASMPVNMMRKDKGMGETKARDEKERVLMRHPMPNALPESPTLPSYTESHFGTSAASLSRRGPPAPIRIPHVYLNNKSVLVNDRTGTAGVTASTSNSGTTTTLSSKSIPGEPAASTSRTGANVEDANPNQSEQSDSRNDNPSSSPESEAGLLSSELPFSPTTFLRPERASMYGGRLSAGGGVVRQDSATLPPTDHGHAPPESQLLQPPSSMIHLALGTPTTADESRHPLSTYLDTPLTAATPAGRLPPANVRQRSATIPDLIAAKGSIAVEQKGEVGMSFAQDPKAEAKYKHVPRPLPHLPRRSKSEAQVLMVDKGQDITLPNPNFLRVTQQLPAIRSPPAMEMPASADLRYEEDFSFSSVKKTPSPQRTPDRLHTRSQSSSPAFPSELSSGQSSSNDPKFKPSHTHTRPAVGASPSKSMSSIQWVKLVNAGRQGAEVETAPVTRERSATDAAYSRERSASPADSLIKLPPGPPPQIFRKNPVPGSSKSRPRDGSVGSRPSTTPRLPTASTEDPGRDSRPSTATRFNDSPDHQEFRGMKFPNTPRSYASTPSMQVAAGHTTPPSLEKQQTRTLPVGRRTKTPQPPDLPSQGKQKQFTTPSSASSGFTQSPHSTKASSPRFDSVPVPWRGLTLDAAKWTFTSKQLQDIAGRAIRASAEASSIRLLPLNVLDTELPGEVERLEARRDEVEGKYRYQVRRRNLLLRSLRLYIDGSDEGTAKRLTEELAEVGNACDQLCEELFVVNDQIAQIAHLRDAHSSSALAMALRKLNNSYIRTKSEVRDLKDKSAKLQAERDEAWAIAEAMERELDTLKQRYGLDKTLERSSTTSTKSGTRSSRVAAARKTSTRASQASLRLSSSIRSARSSSNGSVRFPSVLFPHAPLALLPSDAASAVPPVPDLPSMKSHRIPDVFPTSALAESFQDESPSTPDSVHRALLTAHDELLAMLHLSSKELGRPLTRSRSASASHSASNSPSLSPPRPRFAHRRSFSDIPSLPSSPHTILARSQLEPKTSFPDTPPIRDSTYL